MIDRILPFLEAIAFIADKVIVPESEWDFLDWEDMDDDIQLRAFWSANVENARFLDRAKSFIQATIDKSTKTGIASDGEVREIPQGGGKATFIKEMRDFMVAEGMVDSEEEFFDVEQGDVTDIRSAYRQKLIYDTNMRQAFGYGQWKQGQKPAILTRFPAQQFVRDRRVQVPRPRHEETEGQIRLKSDVEYWADFQNDPEIGGFGVPWPPYGFNSGMGVRDIDREQAEKLGLLEGEPEPIEGELNDNLKSSVLTMDDEAKNKLIAELETYEFPDAAAAGKKAALKVREELGFIEPEKRDSVDAAYDPDQKRYPKGHPLGGQWMDEEKEETIDEIGDQINEIVARLKENEGFTLDLDGQDQFDGYVVSIDKDSERIFDELTEEDVEEYIRDYWEDLNKEGRYFGGWLNSKDGKTYLDVPIIVDTFEEAARLAKENNQIAFFHLNTFTEYDTKDAIRKLETGE